MRRRFDRKLHNQPARGLRAGLRQSLRVPACRKDELQRVRARRVREAAVAALRRAARRI